MKVQLEAVRNKETASMTQTGTKTADLVSALAFELATELDMHFDAEDFFALTPQIAVLERARDWLTASGSVVPDCLDFVIQKGHRARN
jgi:hypothetical protein